MPDRFQAVLSADGSVRFHYGFVVSGDGIVGLFPYGNGAARGDAITAIPDPGNPELPAHLDLLDVTIYETGGDAVIVEFTTRGPILEPDAGTRFSYRLAIDADHPYWPKSHYDHRDAEFEWRIVLRPEGAHYANGGSILRRDGNRIAMVGSIPRELAGIPIGIIAQVACYDDPGCPPADDSRPEEIELARSGPVDLSRSDGRFIAQQSEVFHYRGTPDTVKIACRAIEVLGDEFDMFMFHNEFRIDSQENATPSGPTYGALPTGIGVDDHRVQPAPCGDGRLKKPLLLPILSQNLREDLGVNFLTHEFIHIWSAYLSFLARHGEKETLTNEYYGIHWRGDLHSPAAFPRSAGPESSVMGGSVWTDNGDGTFTPSASWSGLSWFDLYAMGLADASEVPDTFVLRNLEAVVEGHHNPRGETYSGGVYAGDRETVSIDQIVAAEGPRRPSASESQKDFNIGFVYLLEPGQAPSDQLLDAHARLRSEFVENWFRITGGRSRMTTTVPGVANRSPTAVGLLLDQAMSVGGVTVVDVGGAFRDPDGDPLTYQATSAAPAVASVDVSGSTVTVRAVAPGTATVTVTATDVGGSNTTATLAFRVTVERAPTTTFTDDPILPGVTPIKAVHFTELRERIDLLRDGAGLPPFAWTDPILTAGVTPVRLSHLLELREALAEAYRASGRAGPAFIDVGPMSGTTPIRAFHLAELRAAVVALQ